MANRVKLTVLGGTLAPYGSGNATPQLVNGGISEDWHFDVSQLQRFVDTSPAQRTTYPNAQSGGYVKYVRANHFQTEYVYINITSVALDILANT
jgi:hypothetical protein